MPLMKRSIKPGHMCKAVLPDDVGRELECVTNNTLSAIIRQLSSLSKQAEDVFGELFNEANTFYVRANSLQDRLDRLAVKVTQLDSSVEEVSLHDINMKKAFRSSTAEDQQVVSRISIPHPVAEMYNSTEKPPPLSLLSNYRDDHLDGMKFYTDPSYFFDLWKEKMLQDTEDKRKEKRRQREQKNCEDATLQREVKKVRKARNRQQEWNAIAFEDKLHPDHRNLHCIQQRALSEDSLTLKLRPCCPDIPCPAHFMPSHASSSSSEGVEHEYQSIGGPVEVPDRVEPSTSYRFNPPPPPPPLHLPNEGGVNDDITLPPLPPIDYGTMEHDASSGLHPAPFLPTSMISSSQTAFALPHSHHGPTSSALSHSPLPVPPPGALLTSPPPGPPPLPKPPVLVNRIGTEDGRCQDSQPMTEGRSDLLSAIRMGIQLKKVQEQQEQRAKRERSGNDVATILSRRIAVEYSESEDESEMDKNEWSD